MPDSLIKQQYQSLHTLLAQYRKTPLPSDIVQQTLNFNNQLLSAIKQHPELIFAQIHLYKSSLAHTYNIAFSTCLLSALIGIRNRFNETTILQLMCAAVSLFAFDEPRKTKSATPESVALKRHLNKPFCRMLTEYQQAVWLRGYRQVQRLESDLEQHLKHLSNTSADVTVLVIAARLTLLLHQQNSKTPLSFPNALSQIVQNTPGTTEALLEPLMSFPGAAPPGAFVMIEDGSLAVVVGVLEGSVLCFPQSSAQRPSAHTTYFSVDIEHIERVYPAQALKYLSKMHTWWGDAWQQHVQDATTKPLSPFTQSYKMDRPPATLVAIQSQLNKPVQDIKKLSNAIAREPSFAQHLRQTATQSSRQKLPMKDIQHGLMMHGFERSGSIIMQQALLSRLNQHYFPLQHAFINFVQLRGHIASCIAKAADIGVPEQACTLSYFASVGLFIHTQLKIQTQWRKVDTNIYDIASLIRCVKPEQLRIHSVSMAEAWQQPRHEIVALKHYHEAHYLDENKPNASVKLAAILGLSLIIARELYFNTSPLCVQSQQYWQSASKVLKITEQELNEIKQQAYSICHSYSPV
ncbi:histidine kinase [Paraglaciecola chathamensis]|uniref:Histidine kinase n=1 Tax=Paraglaciecola chathamensis TaxID=368405 RepID=A0ABS0WA01_9ALTE|nr:histidine kinase [Paraglaciecola chathamensis]